MCNLVKSLIFMMTHITSYLVSVNPVPKVCSWYVLLAFILLLTDWRTGSLCYTKCWCSNWKKDNIICINSKWIPYFHTVAIVTLWQHQNGNASKNAINSNKKHQQNLGISFNSRVFFSLDDKRVILKFTWEEALLLRHTLPRLGSRKNRDQADRKKDKSSTLYGMVL